MKIFIQTCCFSLLLASCATKTKSKNALDSRKKQQKLDVKSLMPKSEFSGDNRGTLYKKGWIYGKRLGGGDYFYGGWVKVQVLEQTLDYDLGMIQ